MKVQVDFTFLALLKNQIALRLAERLHHFEIDGLVVDQAFSVVHLRTGHTGISMNYATVFSGREKMRDVGLMLNAALPKDPLLLNTLWDMGFEMDPLLRCSLQTSLLSALSKPLLVTPTVNKIRKINGGVSLREVVQEGDTVAVIGLGGYLQSALENPLIRRVHLADFFISQPNRKETIDSLRKKYPDKELIATDGSENEAILAESQIACLTASALSNGSLDALLKACKTCRTIILQGHSGYVFPEPLFERGISFITTSVVPADGWNRIQTYLREYPKANLAQFLDLSFTEKIGYGRMSSDQPAPKS